MTGYYDDAGNWHEGPGPYEDDPYAPPPPDEQTTMGWLYDPNQPPTADPGPGYDWSWNGTQWTPVHTPQAMPAPTPGGGGMTEAQGRAYDAERGFIGGYMGPNGWVSGSPSSGSGDGGITTGGAGGLGAFPDYSTRLPFSPYEAMGAFQPRDDTFEDDTFTPSSWEDAQAEPGFAQSQDRLSKHVQNSAAYRGMVRSGMTIGNLDSVLDSNRGQNFAQFDDRRFRNWQGNRDDRFRGWNANLGVDRDKYQFGATENERRNNFRFNTERESFANELARWQEQVRSITSLSRPV